VTLTSICQRLNWDSEFFGLPVARLSVNHLDLETAKDIRSWTTQNEGGCLYFLCPADDSISLALAQRLGFRFVDIRITLERPLSRTTLPVGEAEGIRPAQPSDIDRLKAIARASHTDTRFYADGNFSPEQCAALYAVWIERSCSDFADVALVATRSQRPIGYVTCRLEGDKTGQIGLLAVAAGERGTGCGGRLLTAAAQWFYQKGCQRIITVTQGRNLAALRLYQRQGFTIHSVDLWFHLWSSESRPLAEDTPR
jgi:dTDP-4-amino-4,6-dideoxy-D-galactose acyltransferase